MIEKEPTPYDHGYDHGQAAGIMTSQFAEVKAPRPDLLGYTYNQAEVKEFQAGYVDGWFDVREELWPTIEDYDLNTSDFDADYFRSLTQ